MTPARGSATRPASSPSELDRSADIANLGRVFDLDVMRERILAAAITNLADHGFGAFTVREVAAVAGIKAPGLYSHFPSKEAILTEAVSRVLADFLENSTHVDGVKPEDDLRETVRTIGSAEEVRRSAWVPSERRTSWAETASVARIRRRNMRVRWQ